MRRILHLHPFSPENREIIEREIHARESGALESPRRRRLTFMRVGDARWFYEIRLESGLAGGWLLIRRWGRCGSRGWQLIHQHLSVDEAVREIERVASQQWRRGYRRAVWDLAPSTSPHGQLALAFGTPECGTD